MSWTARSRSPLDAEPLERNDAPVAAYRRLARRRDGLPPGYAYTGTAIVTGAAHGIGRELALALAHRGQPLLLVDRDRQGLDATCTALRDRTHEAWAGDVTDPAFAERVVSRAGRDLSAVYLLAGTIHVGTAAVTAQAHASRVVETNLLAPTNWAHLSLGSRRLRRGGRLVLTSSAFGVLPVAGYSAYAASKSGLSMLAEVLALEEWPDVRVHHVVLGGISTGILARGSYAPGVDARRVQDRFLRRVARTTPQQAAQRILRGADLGRRRIVVGADARLACAAQRLSPTLSRAASSRLFPPP